jgi:hydrogenase maturation factor HypF (carbamoyltransferase family)
MQPTPVVLGEQLPQPIYGCTLLCRACRSDLLYQRQERPRFPKHFFWCPHCGGRFAAAEPWSGRRSPAM